ncbi:MAG: tRNA uridine(34) 5-carboxymethylaminomethyl modification radical SAM/GNAT enzyme Elp3 [Promethearchaeota archaeon]
MLIKENSNSNLIKACRGIIKELLESRSRSRNELNNLKSKYCKVYHLSTMPKNAQILENATPDERELLLPVLKRRRTRTLSGVSVIAVMTRPFPCPGNCIYCPGEDSQPGDPVAQSYTGREPAALRSLMFNYDPYRQVSERIKDLEAIGHSCDKIELIIMGGTFLSTPLDYQRYFVKRCIDGVLGHETSSLAEAKELAEFSSKRIIGLTFETRPDYCLDPQIDAMLDYGGTRVEIGVQTVFDDILALVNRGHDVAASKLAIQLAKDAGFKVCLHLMPNLPGSSLDRDMEMFTEIFTNDAFKPDYLKIYPCLVIGGTVLEKWWRDGRYKPYPVEELATLLARVKSELPSWIRIQRVQRDIPAYLILDGVKNSNFREIVWKRMDELGLSCNCIRCREFGFSRRSGDDKSIPSIDNLVIKKEFYNASGGIECFISAVDEATDDLFGYVRLRKPSKLVHRPEIKDNVASIIRELRVVGEVVPVKNVAKRLQVQHRGLGKKLMHVAEDVVKKRFGSKKLLVIAGIGVRPYFYRLGYKPDGPYVSKIL